MCRDTGTKIIKKAYISLLLPHTYLIRHCIDPSFNPMELLRDVTTALFYDLLLIDADRREMALTRLYKIVIGVLVFIIKSTSLKIDLRLHCLPSDIILVYLFPNTSFVLQYSLHISGALKW